MQPPPEGIKIKISTKGAGNPSAKKLKISTEETSDTNVALNNTSEISHKSSNNSQPKDASVNDTDADFEQQNQVVQSKDEKITNTDPIPSPIITNLKTESSKSSGAKKATSNAKITDTMLFNHFSSIQKPKLKAEGSTLKGQALKKTLEDTWNNLTEEEKKPYHEGLLAAREKAREARRRRSAQNSAKLEKEKAKEKQKDKDQEQDTVSDKNQIDEIEKGQKEVDEEPVSEPTTSPILPPKNQEPIRMGGFTVVNRSSNA